MVFLRTPFEEGAAKFSPDGRWVAFVSTDSGESEVYVAAIGEASAKRRVSSAGGEAPRWRGDGRELFYLAPDNTVMAVDIHMRPRFEAGVPRPLFVPGRVFRRPQKAGHGAYDVTGDGQRFVVNILVEDDTTAPISVVLNWSAGLPDSNRRLLSWR
jgi:eukaryotic-like serine/threonine-protein kinase